MAMVEMMIKRRRRMIWNNQHGVMKKKKRRRRISINILFKIILLIKMFLRLVGLRCFLRKLIFLLIGVLRVLKGDNSIVLMMMREMMMRRRISINILFKIILLIKMYHRLEGLRCFLLRRIFLLIGVLRVLKGDNSIVLMMMREMMMRRRLGEIHCWMMMRDHRLNRRRWMMILMC